MEQKRRTGFSAFLKSDPFLTGAAALLILVALSLISAQNYLLFHGITEIVTIAIAFSIFILVWNNRGIITDTFFLIIGISFLFTGSIDLLHTLAYKGMGVFPGSTADLPTQLWIAARYFQSIAFLVATLLIGKTITRDRRYDIAIIIAACTAACGLLLASIFIWQDFPACFIEGTGLTLFKIVSEYIISLVLAATVVVLYTRRRSFDPEVWRFLVAAQVFLVLGELAFTTYASVYGVTNMLGHLFKLVSFYLFYRAIIVVGITRPYDLLFRDLVENINDVIFTMDTHGRIVYVSPVISRLFGYAPDTIRGQDFIRFIHSDDCSRYAEWFKKSRDGERSENEFRISTQDGRERYVLISVCPVVQVGRTGMFTCTLADITERRQAEDELPRKNEDLQRAYEKITATDEELRKNLEDLRERDNVIRESEEKYRSLVEHSPYAVLLTRPGGAILSANAAACRLLGRTEDEIKKIGRPGVVDTNDPRVAAAVAERERVGTAIAREMTFIRRDGSRFEGEVSSAIFLDRNGQPMSSMIFSDISERKRTQEALKESEELLRATLDNMDEGVQIIGFDWRYRYLNDAVVRQSSLTREDLTGRTMMEVYPGIEKTGMFARLRDCMENRVRSRMDNEFTYPNGSRGWFSLSIQPHSEGVFILSEDITGQKQADEALQESEARYRSLIETTGTGYVILDKDGRVLTANREYVRLTGRSTLADIEGRPVTSWTASYDLERNAREVEQCLEKGMVRGLEIDYQKPDGAIQPVEINASVVDSGSGQIILTLVRDITDRKRAETILAHVNRALRMFSNSNHALVHITDETTLMNEICRIVVEVGGYRLAWIGFAEQDEAKTVRPVAHAGFESGYIESANVTWADSERGRGPGGSAIRTGQPCIARNIFVDPAFAPWREAAIERGYKSNIALPLISEGQTFGELAIYSVDTDAFDTKEVNILKELADDLAFGITALRMRVRRKRAEEALQESEARLRSILQASPVMQFSIDINHHVISWNKAIETYSGIQAEDIIGTDGQWQAFYQEKRPVLADILLDQNIHLLPDWYPEKFSRSRFVDEGYEATDFFPYMGGSGKWLHGTAVPIRDAKGAVTGAIETLEDITERKNAEDALRESEKFLNSVFENIPDMIFVKDARDLRFVRFNKAGEELLGFSREELYGKNDHDFFPKNEADFFTRKDREVLKNRQLVDIPEEKIQTRLKGRRILHTKKIPIIDESGKPGYLMGISEDITERRRMENALQLARSKISLLNTVTFQDIQSAAFSIAAYQEILRTYITDEKAKEFLEKQRALNQKIVSSLDFAKNYQDMGVKPPRWQNIVQVFLLAISHLDFLHIARNLQVENLEVYADPLLEMVFFHLMQNVLRYGGHATGVTLRYEEIPDGLVLFIEDNGAGIPVEEKPLIFDREHGKNTGLGLFFVREALSITDMIIKETGVPGKGARFEILVPKDGYRFIPEKT